MKTKLRGFKTLTFLSLLILGINSAMGAPDDPFAQMDRMHQQMQERMKKFFSESGIKREIFEGSIIDDAFFNNRSRISIASDGLKIEEHEDDDFKYVEVIADGIDRSSFNVKVSDGMISISGEVKKTDDTQSSDSRSMSSYTSSFKRSFNIPHGVNGENVQVDTKDKKIILKFPKIRV